jgi:tetratricopeptide (TPR) repeat protein
MASQKVSYISKTLLSILFIAGMLIAPVKVWAQEPTEEEYKSLTDIQAEKDVTKKADMIFSFLKEKPKTAYRPNVVAEYQKIMDQFGDEKNWNRIVALGERFIDIAPNDDFTERYLTAAYSATNNNKGFVTYAEKAYASKPSTALAVEIAKAYKKLGNDAKYMQWREKILASDPENIEILVDMVQRYQASNNTAQALKYAKLCLQALPTAKKPEGLDAQAWKNMTDAGYAVAYGVIGANAYQSQNYAVAITNLNNAIRYYKNMDQAYYLLGVSYWQKNQLEPAMLNFAKAYLLKGSYAAGAKKYLDQLWASGHRGSLAGVERVIERARQDLK